MSLYRPFSFLISLLVCAGVAPAQQVTIRPDSAARRIDIRIDDAPFTSYIYPENLEKPVLYPIYTAAGSVITRGFPLDPRPGERVDHPHHVGLWFNFENVNGLDFWNNSYAIPAANKHRYGSIKHRRITGIKEGKRGSLGTESVWVDQSGKILLTERTTFFFTQHGSHRLIERRTTLIADTQVTFRDSKDGLIAIRMDRAFEDKDQKEGEFHDAQGKVTRIKALDNTGVNGIYRNSEGKEKESGVWGKPARWVSLSATKNKEQISVAIIDHPKNPGYPAYSHARGYGLFASNNLAVKAFNPAAEPVRIDLKPGEELKFRHLIVISSGGFLSKGELDKLAERFGK
ncbi:hypothetical protein C7T94_00260 [Pedobacter yulinensis]|uniref:Methane oxygenase PmoA n=1 Tax=Pedobacter yulinensis TaxID=2126353 RepID=A0A2T3HQ86_9SPHI|nr:PmoA family protein [Pedobacter yulinensis]PST84608.1 hypothetical protein C7T94_00260 [Pedobacter yulinensis]